MTLTPIAERLAVELPLSVITTSVYRGWDSNPTFRLRGQHSNRLRHRRGLDCFKTKRFIKLNIQYNIMIS